LGKIRQGLAEGWAEEQKLLYDPKTDKKGPFVVAVVVEPQAPQKRNQSDDKPPKSQEKKADPEKPQANPQSYLAVFGDADFAADQFFNQLGNSDLFLNTVNFLAAEEKQIIIRKDDKKLEPLTLTRWKTFIVFFISVILMPLAMLAAGLVVYFRRRALR
jgi:ABC-type uncharacterized transport system involved in gliding motility auxiliary subunit